MSSMRKIILATNVTPDGFCDHRAVLADNELHQFYADLLKDADTLLFGRKTFQLLEPYWPTVAKNRTGTKGEIAFADQAERIHKVVFSRSGITSNWNNTTILSVLDEDIILRMKEQPGKNILVGSPSIVDQLAMNGLIDEFCFLIQPIVAGSGKRFFETASLPKHLTLNLKESRLLGSGVIVMWYEKKGP